MVKLTRRQWLELPVEMKTEAAGRRCVVAHTDQGAVPVMVVFVKTMAESDMKQQENG